MVKEGSSMRTYRDRSPMLKEGSSMRSYRAVCHEKTYCLHIRTAKVQGELIVGTLCALVLLQFHPFETEKSPLLWSQAICVVSNNRIYYGAQAETRKSQTSF